AGVSMLAASDMAARTSGGRSVGVGVISPKRLAARNSIKISGISIHSTGGTDDRVVSSGKRPWFGEVGRPQKTMVCPTEQHSRNQTWGGRPRPLIGVKIR